MGGATRGDIAHLDNLVQVLLQAFGQVVVRQIPRLEHGLRPPRNLQGSRKPQLSQHCLEDSCGEQVYNINTGGLKAIGKPFAWHHSMETVSHGRFSEIHARCGWRKSGSRKPAARSSAEAAGQTPRAHLLSTAGLQPLLQAGGAVEGGVVLVIALVEEAADLVDPALAVVALDPAFLHLQTPSDGSRRKELRTTHGDPATRRLVPTRLLVESPALRTHPATLQLCSIAMRKSCFDADVREATVGSSIHTT